VVPGCLVGVRLGGIVGLFVVGTLRRGRPVGRTARGSLLATAALAAVFVAGAAMATMILDGVGELTGTDWGRRLLLKTSGVGVAALIGAYHRLVDVPRLAALDPTDEAGDPTIAPCGKRGITPPALRRAPPCRPGRVCRSMEA